jgi:pSer/pThr/pTyr-binding forkhead associated (FHA) protein
LKNYYAILEVPVGCQITEIREAYRRLVQENLWNKETFAELKEAYEVLTTPARRNEYDKATFGETFPSGETTSMPLAADNGVGSSARQCPMGAAAQCPVINARVPLQETYCPECGFLLAAMAEREFEPVAQIDPARQMRLEDNTGRPYLLRPGINTVGREGTDVILAEKTVSRRHAQIEIGDNGQVMVEDLGSTNGTRIHGVPLTVGVAKPILDGQGVQFGSIDLRLHLPQITSEEGASSATPTAVPTATVMPTRSVPARAVLIGIRGRAQREIPLVPGVTTFGRRPENSVVLNDDPYVSGSHAQIIADNDVFRLTDLESRNGTLVNGTSLTANQPHELTEGDEVVIGGTAYRFERRSVPDTEPPQDDDAVAPEADEPTTVSETDGQTDA